MKQFDPVARVTVEETAHGLTSQVLGEVRKIEEQAKVIREAGGNPRIELEEEVQSLAQRVTTGHRMSAEGYREQLAQVRKDWETQRDRKPQLEAVQWQRAQAKINGMTDAEVENIVGQYAVGERVDLDHMEAQLLLARLREPVSRQAFKEMIAEQRIDQPWLTDPEHHQLLDAAELHEKAPAGTIASELGTVHIESIIDFDSELEAPA